MAAAALLTVLASTGRAATPPPLRAARAAVASDHAAASAAGVAALAAGGNAADAACATALALGVLNPHASGIGGGGFALVYVASERKVYALDFRETAPAALRPEMFLKDGKPEAALSMRGGLAVGVPGEVRGLGELVRRFGRRPFAACVAPAERIARGFTINDYLARAINETVADNPQTAPFIKRMLALEAPVRPGLRARRPQLAVTLARLRQRGPDAFYAGPLARAIVDSVKAAGGVMTLEDLAGYRVVEREPIVTSYRGRAVYGMPPPSSGGILIAEALAILEQVMPDPRAVGFGSSAYFHVLAEALKHGFADRARHVGDPAFTKVPVDRLLDPAYHRELAGRVRPDAVLPLERYGLAGSPDAPARGGGTAHLSVIDEAGNAVSLTTTVNLTFGAHLLAGETGIVLNDEMDDFAMAPTSANAFGLFGGAANAPQPGKRPLSSMSPTIVLEEGRPRVVVGGAGGPRIISSTLQVLLAVLDFGLNAQAASAAPRIHHQWRPDDLLHEPEIPRDVLDALARRGHHVVPWRPAPARVNVVVRTPGGLEAAAEYRSNGAPAGY